MDIFRVTPPYRFLSCNHFLSFRCEVSVATLIVSLLQPFQEICRPIYTAYMQFKLRFELSILSSLSQVLLQCDQCVLLCLKTSATIGYGIDEAVVKNREYCIE